MLLLENIRDSNEFEERLSHTDWSMVLQSCRNGEVVSAYSSFIQKYLDVYNLCFPVTTCNQKSVKFDSEWMTADLLKLCKKKNNLYRAYLKTPSEKNKQKFKTCRNRFKTLKSATIKQYYSLKLQSCGKNLNAVWKIIKSLIGRSEFGEPCANFLGDDGNYISSSSEIADSFNKYFSTIGSSLADKIPPTKLSFSDYLRSPAVHSMSVMPATEAEIISIATNLKTSHSSGIDGVDPCLTKKTIKRIALPLTTLINSSLTLGIFPDELKIAKVIPLFKAGEKFKISNYRPISILNYFSKFFERIMHTRLYSYLSRFSLISNSQYGFRKHHSTYMPLVILLSKITEALDQGKHTIGIFLDLAKAFDTVNHEILLKKLEYYGVRGIQLKWFTSYLSNRLQYVCYNNTKSSITQISCGVPQGSILGPLLFIIYINDLPQVSKLFDCFLFADDTNFFASGYNLDTLFDDINHALVPIFDWFCANKLSLNLKKTNYLIFHHRNRSVQTDSCLYIHNMSINRASSCKFLGVIVDESLTWLDHICHVMKKISRNIGVLSRISYLVDMKTSLMLYYALIFPYISYCNIVWASNYPSRLKPLHVLHKRSIRVMFHIPWRSSCKFKFLEHKILNTYQLNSFQIGMFMYSYANNLLPAPFADLIVKSSDIYSYGLRSASHFRPALARTTLRSFSIGCVGPRLYLSIPSSITSSMSLFSFNNLNLIYYR